jgi:Flp pilus assembly protein TadD/SAM-dependent methyltransferase
MNQEERRAGEKLAATSRVQALFSEAAQLHNAGRLADAERLYQQILAIDPRHADSLNGLGLVAFRAGRPDMAAETLGKAVASNPRHHFAQMHLGLALAALGQPDKALICYQAALSLKPDLAEAHTNLGNLYWGQGKLAEAEACYRRLLASRPDDVLALNNFAALRMVQGDFAMAMNLIARSLSIQETPKAKRLFAAVARQLRWTGDGGGIRPVMTRALSEPWTRPAKLAPAAGEIVKLHPVTGPMIARAAAAWPRPLTAAELYGPDGLNALATDTLLQALLTATPNCDIALEYFLTNARFILLAAARAGEDAAPQALAFHAALAQQCFINEYVFALSEDEARDAESLRGQIAEALETGASLAPLTIAALASYFPLHTVPQASRLLERQWPEPIAALLTQQIREPEEERRLAEALPALTGIEDDISRIVRAQYEENPYPRWVRPAPPEERVPLFFDLSQKFATPFARYNHSGHDDILVAGCGTGQNAIEWATKYAGTELLAVDLSRASLGYAARKARELQLGAITFAQADLLELASPGRRFDAIECAGVLHHLADPWAGWKSLLALLKPGGFMFLGLYSRTGRADIAKARAKVADAGFSASADGIRRCRQALLARRADFEATVASEDFFSISACRDLIFHVQEQQTGLDEIAPFLKANGLAFLGFELEGPMRQAYLARYPGDPQATDLAQWQRFEAENPDIFAGMYQFWVQKAG